MLKLLSVTFLGRIALFGLVAVSISQDWYVNLLFEAVLNSMIPAAKAEKRSKKTGRLIPINIEWPLNNRPSGTKYSHTVALACSINTRYYSHITLEIKILGPELKSTPETHCHTERY